MSVDSSGEGALGAQQLADMDVETTREQLAGALDASLRLCTEFADRCGLGGGSAALAEPAVVLRTAMAPATPPHQPFIFVPANRSGYALSSRLTMNLDGDVCIPSGGAFSLPTSSLPTESKACDPITFYSPAVSCLQQRARQEGTSSGCAVAVLRLEDALREHSKAQKWARMVSPSRLGASNFATDLEPMPLKVYHTLLCIAMPVLLYRVRRGHRAALRAMRIWRGVHAHPHLVAAVEAAMGEVVLAPPEEQANNCAPAGHHVARALLAALGCALVSRGLYLWQFGSGGDGGLASFLALSTPPPTLCAVIIVQLAFLSVPVRADVPTTAAAASAAIGIGGGGGGSTVAVDGAGSGKLRQRVTTGTVDASGAYSPLAQQHTAYMSGVTRRLW